MGSGPVPLREFSFFLGQFMTPDRDDAGTLRRQEEEEEEEILARNAVSGLFRLSRVELASYYYTNPSPVMNRPINLKKRKFSTTVATTKTCQESFNSPGPP